MVKNLKLKNLNISLIKVVLNMSSLKQKTPQRNGVVERQNWILEEIARKMLNESNLSKYFWAEAVNIACRILKRVLVRPLTKKIPYFQYELWNERKPNIGYIKIFGCKCFILNNKNQLQKFDSKADRGIFIGNSPTRKAYVVYHKTTQLLNNPSMLPLMNLTVFILFKQMMKRRQCGIMEELLSSLQKNSWRKARRIVPKTF